MSEITKACDACTQFGYAEACPSCLGTNRVPDVEANLRAQLDAARLMCERFDSSLRTKEAENTELRADVARLTEERNFYSARAREWEDRIVGAARDLIAEGRKNDALTATLAERDGEVARLEDRVQGAANILRDGQWNGRGAFWHGPCCPNCGGTERTGHYANCARAAWLAGCRS